LTTNEWEECFATLEAWFTGSLGDKKRMAYRMSPLNECSFDHLFTAIKHLATKGQVWVPTVGELMKAMDFLGYGKEPTRSCRKCHVSITDRTYRSNAGRCDDCYAVYEDAVLSQHNRLLGHTVRKIDAGRLALIAYHLDEKEREVTVKSVRALCNVGEAKAEALVEEFYAGKREDEGAE